MCGQGVSPTAPQWPHMNATTLSPTPASDDRWVTLPQGRIFTRRWSPPPPPGATAQPPIVLFHESLGSVALWRDFPATLCAATGRAVLAYDRLGFGQSDPHPGAQPLDFVAEEARSTLPALRAQLGIDRYVALGHSVGGGMAVHCAAADAGGHCQALVTIAAQACVEERTLQGIRDARDQFQAHPAQLERLARVTCPVLALHGALDEYGSTEQAVRIARWAAGPARVEILLGAGHVPHREQPQAVAGLVAGFVDGLGGGR